MLRYKEAKKELLDYIKQMDDLCEWHKEMLAEHEDDIFECKHYDVSLGRRFVKVWEAMDKLPVKDKHLICLYQIYKPKEVLEVFSDDIKNTGALSKLYYKAKVRLKEILKK